MSERRPDGSFWAPEQEVQDSNTLRDSHTACVGLRAALREAGLADRIDALVARLLER